MNELEKTLKRKKQLREAQSRKRQAYIESGLVRKEVWIRPEYTEDLKHVEQYFRQPDFKVWYYTGHPGVSIEGLNK